MPAFDPSHAVQFDLAKGQVKLGGSVSQVLVSPSALGALLSETSGESVQRFGRQLGSELGGRLLDRLGRELKTASIETLVEHLGGELALLGLGSLGVERWGRALVITVDGPPLAKEGDALLAAVLQGALERAFDRKSAVLAVARRAAQARFLVVADRVQSRVQSWITAGESLGAIVDKLHAASPI
jgi:hypothetical protein